jgi:hypothetical protein
VEPFEAKGEDSTDLAEAIRVGLECVTGISVLEAGSAGSSMCFSAGCETSGLELGFISASDLIESEDGSSLRLTRNQPSNKTPRLISAIQWHL